MYSKTRKIRHALSKSYGRVILPKGTILYHASTNELCVLPMKPVLFTTLHPSEWYYENAYISVLELQKDIELLFMVKLIIGFRVISALNDYLDKENSNLAKMDYRRIEQWLPYMKKERFDGWFSSIENKTAIEIAIINDSSLIKIVNCEPLIYNWTNSTYNNNTLIQKKWGSKYPINQTAKFKIHTRFKPQIENYLRKIKEEDPQSTALSKLLQNSIIEYVDAPIYSVKWTSGTDPS
jgi:hypothetical protein